MKDFKTFLNENKEDLNESDARKGLVTIYTKNNTFDGIAGVYRKQGVGKGSDFSIDINSQSNGSIKIGITNSSGNSENIKDIQSIVNHLADIESIFNKLAELKVGDSLNKVNSVVDRYVKGSFINYAFYENK